MPCLQPSNKLLHESGTSEILIITNLCSLQMNRANKNNKEKESSQHTLHMFRCDSIAALAATINSENIFDLFSYSFDISLHDFSHTNRIKSKMKTKKPTEAQTPNERKKLFFCFAFRFGTVVFTASGDYRTAG